MWRATAHVFRHHERNNKSENYTGIVFSKERVQTFPAILLKYYSKVFCVSRSAIPQLWHTPWREDCFAEGSLPFSFFLTGKFFFLTRSFWRTRKWLVSFLSGGRVSFFFFFVFYPLRHWIDEDEGTIVLLKTHFLSAQRQTSIIYTKASNHLFSKF